MSQQMNLTLGERVAWHRRRRGLSQDVLAGLVGRTVDWLSKLENNRMDLDRLSVIRQLANALGVGLHDLIAETEGPLRRGGTDETGAMARLRAAVTNYRFPTPFTFDKNTEPPRLEQLQKELDALWAAYQGSQYMRVAQTIPLMLSRAHDVAHATHNTDIRKARAILASTYQVAATILGKLGESDLAWVAAERGLAAAHASENPLTVGALLRTTTHALLCADQSAAAIQLAEETASLLRRERVTRSPCGISIYGTLLLTGSMAAAAAADRNAVRSFLTEASRAADHLGEDANHAWTSFGPTNVAVHHVATALDLGDVQVAIRKGPRVEASTLPTERRARHAITIAQACSMWNQRESALDLLLTAERLAPEQVHRHRVSSRLVLELLRRPGVPPDQLVSLARRMGAL